MLDNNFSTQGELTSRTCYNCFLVLDHHLQCHTHQNFWFALLRTIIAQGMEGHIEPSTVHKNVIKSKTSMVNRRYCTTMYHQVQGTELQLFIERELQNFFDSQVLNSNIPLIIIFFIIQNFLAASY